MSDPSPTLHNLYRIVGIQNDGTRVVLATHLRMDKAREIIDALRGAFSSVQIDLRPLSATQLARTNKDQRRKPQCGFDSKVSLVAA